MPQSITTSATNAISTAAIFSNKPDPQPGRERGGQIHRRVLQSDPPPLDARLPEPGPLRDGGPRVSNQLSTKPKQDQSGVNLQPERPGLQVLQILSSSSDNAFTDMFLLVHIVSVSCSPRRGQKRGHPVSQVLASTEQHQLPCLPIAQLIHARTKRSTQIPAFLRVRKRRPAAPPAPSVHVDTFFKGMPCGLG